MLSLAAVVLTIPAKFELTVPNIMRAPDLIGRPPTNVRWSADGSKVRFTWRKPDGTAEPQTQQYVVNRDGTGLQIATDTEPTVRNPWDSGSRLNGKIAYEERGDLFLVDEQTKTPAPLLATPERENDPRFTSDGKSVLFFRSGDLFRIDVESKTVSQLTAAAGKEVAGAVVLKTTDGTPTGNILPSANGTHVSSSTFKPAEGVVTAEVPSYITSSGYSQLIRTYARVGQPQPTSKAIFYDLRTGQPFEMAPARAGTVGAVRWSPDGRYAVAWAFAQDYKDAWLMKFDTASNKVSTVYTEHDDGWVGGPARGVLGWLPDSSRFYFQSEANGFSNLYAMSPTSDEPKNLTEGKFEVSDLRLDIPRKRFLFVSSEGSPYYRHIAELPFDGGSRRKVADFSADEDASYVMSPDGKDFAVIRSAATNRPAELFVNGKQVTTTPTEEWLAGPWINPPIVDVPARDGVKVPAKLFKPKGWQKGGPAVIFIHGAGYLQNVYEGWSHYFREYMFHHVLMDKGYAVLDIDYRASAGYGKAWRTAIYRHMGGKDLEDVLDGAAYLVKEVGADPKRLGVYGGSYGGFLTLMAMFTSPDTFASGAALRPVVDWASYHHGYTAPILNTPKEDPEAFKRSSPINFVEGLKGNLLICHGVVDTNVHFQDSVRLTQRLIDLGKDNWEIAPYPVENHAFTRPESWTDEYKRILNLFERTIGGGWKR